MGGRCSLIERSDYRFDQGPSLLLLPKLFHETFNDLDTSLVDEGVQLLKCEPNYNLFFADGETFQLSTDASVMKREIEKWEGKAGFDRYLQWMSEAHKHYELSVREVLRKNFEWYPHLVRWSFLKHVFEMHPFVSIYSRASKYFWSERLRRVFTFGSMYMGMSPFDAPGTYSLLPYSELAEGIWYPVGGFQKVAKALQGICERLGVVIRLNTAVKEVLTTDNGLKAIGVKLENGEMLKADLVIVNADLVYAYNNLFPSSTPRTKTYAKSLQKRDASCSSISFYWSLSEKVPELTTHNIFLADEYRESFDSIFTRQGIPNDPSFYVNVPSRIDPTAAPEGKDALVILVPVGHLLNSSSQDPNTNTGAGISPEADWTSLVKSTRATILSTIEARTKCAPLGPLIIDEEVNNPYTWEEKFNLDKGAILGLSHSFFNVLAFRPKTKHPQIEGVYFVGASTHPGTGVPIVLAGAKITTEQILNDRGMRIPWAGKEAAFGDMGVSQNGKTKELDVLKRPIGWGTWVAAIMMLLLVLVYAKTGFVVDREVEGKKGFDYGWVKQ